MQPLVLFKLVRLLGVGDEYHLPFDIQRLVVTDQFLMLLRHLRTTFVAIVGDRSAVIVYV